MKYPNTFGALAVFLLILPSTAGDRLCRKQLPCIKDGKVCGKIFDSELILYSEKNAETYQFFTIGGRTYGTCLLPLNSAPIQTTLAVYIPDLEGNSSNATSATNATETTLDASNSTNAAIVDVTVTVSGIDFDDDKAKDLFEETFTEESRASSGTYEYHSTQGRGRQLTALTRVDAKLSYDNQSVAEENIQAMEDKGFQAKLVDKLIEKDGELFRDTFVSEIQASLSSSTAQTTTALRRRRRRKRARTTPDNSPEREREVYYYTTAFIACAIIFSVVIVIGIFGYVFYQSTLKQAQAMDREGKHKGALCSDTPTNK